MILLIPSGTKKQVVIPTLFKFHYDSIKELHRLMINLNSIMILLILLSL